MELREQNETYAEIGRKLIESEPIFEHIKNSKATICYLSSDAKILLDRYRIIYVE